MINVSGRKGRIFIRACKSTAEAEMIAREWINDGYKSVRVNNIPYG